MAPGKFRLELHSDEIDERAIHEALRTIGHKQLTATFIAEATEGKELGSPALPDGAYEIANERLCESFLLELRSAMAKIPYLQIISASPFNEVPYMVQMKVHVARIGAMVDAVKVDVDSVLDAEVIRGRKVARFVRDTREGFDVLIAVMDESGYFVTARLSVLLNEEGR